jgi:hypothetical protein
MLAADLAMALDPVGLVRQAGVEPDEWQADLLRSQASQMMLLCSRQAGKSTVSAFLALHEANYGPPAPTLLLSPSLRQSQELFRTIRDALTVAGDVLGPVRQETALSVELKSGARIICLPGQEKTIRGFSGVRLLVVDEASRVDDALYQAVRPMLAVSGGRIILLSTPFGKRGFFFHEWTDGGPTWKRIKIKAEDVPRIPPAFLAQERAALPEWVYQQEYECQFVETEDSAFRYDDIAAALDPDLEPLFGLSPLPARSNGHAAVY